MYTEKYFAIKHKTSSLFWNGGNFMPLFNKLDVFSVAIDVEDFQDELKTIPESLRSDCFLSEVIIEINIIS